MLLYHCLGQSTRRAASLAEFLGQAQRRRTQCAYTGVCQCQLACTSLCPGDATPSSWSSTLPCLVLAQLKQIENAVITLTIINISLKNYCLFMASCHETGFFYYFSICYAITGHSDNQKSYQRTTKHFNYATFQGLRLSEGLLMEWQMLKTYKPLFHKIRYLVIVH